MAADNQSYLSDTSQFDVARKRAEAQSRTNLQARKDALSRRFASLGNLDAGARIKQEEIAANEESANLYNANEGIDAAQNAELTRRKEVLQGQQFQSGEAEKARSFGTKEREASQGFASSQADLQRKFSTGERLSSQDFAGLQAQLGRNFTTSEREALQDYQTKATDKGQRYATGEREAVQKFQSREAKAQRDVQQAQFAKTYGLSLQQFEAAKAQFADTFKEEQRINDKNIDFAQQALDKKGFIESLTDSNSPVGQLTGIYGNIRNAVGSWL